MQTTPLSSVSKKHASLDGAAVSCTNPKKNLHEIATGGGP
jgi:hypothetical protein